MKKDYEAYIRKENFKTETKSMVENVQDELYQLENKQAKGAKIQANLAEAEGEKCSKTFFKVLDRLNMQNQTISQFYTDDNKSKYSSNPENIFKSAKKRFTKNYTP